MPVILGANSASGGYNITNSLRFNSGSSDYLNRTFSAGNQGLWTFSCWFKVSTLSVDQVIFGRQVDGSNIGYIGLRSDNKLEVINKISTVGVQFTTDAVYRDVSAWYHLVVAFDGSQATQSNRLKLYINGVVQSGSYDAVLGTGSGLINGNASHAIGRRETLNDNYFSGYITEAYFINAQQLTPTSFGETDEDTGIWKPKAYTGTYGTNGFYLQFKNSASLGTDSSGNGNNFTVNNLTSIDQTTDTPTNNFATMNPLDQTSITSVTNGNLTVTTNGTVSSNIRGTFAVSSGKWYWEVKCVSFDTAGTWMIGVADITTLISSSTWSSANAWSYYGANGEKYNSGSSSAYGATYTTNDIISVLLDMNNGTLIFYKNGVSQGTAFSTGLTGKLITPVIGSGLYSVVVDFNFGSPPFTISSGNADANGIGNFEYSVPSGYLALCTANLATNG